MKMMWLLKLRPRTETSEETVGSLVPLVVTGVEDKLGVSVS